MFDPAVFPLLHAFSLVWSDHHVAEVCFVAAERPEATPAPEHIFQVQRDEERRDAQHGCVCFGLPTWCLSGLYVEVGQDASLDSFHIIVCHFMNACFLP
jgi:hypothetical protein